MSNKDPYREFLKEEFTNLIDSLTLSEMQKKFLSSRWLDQMLWMEAQAGKLISCTIRLLRKSKPKTLIIS